MHTESTRLLSLFGAVLLILISSSSQSFSQKKVDSLSKPSNWVNHSFNRLYKQNSDAGFFGNEYGNPIKTSLVADLNPNVLVVNTIKSRFFVLFSPRVKLRLLDARKAPVRSPSYMPALKVFTRINEDTLRPKFLSLAYSHHSNGQDGPTLDSIGNFNRGKGKFTTNYYTLEYTSGIRSVNLLTAKSHYRSLALEVHTGLFNVGFSDELTDKYGFIRINGQWKYDLFRGKSANKKTYDQHHRIHARFTYLADRVKDYQWNNLGRRVNATVQYSYQPGFAGNVALALTAGYRGQDDYNIYFEDKYSYMSVGVVYGVAFNMRKD